MKTKNTSVARLQELKRMLTGNRNAYYANMNGSLSSRMYQWIDDYNDARGTPEWTKFCAMNGFDEGHDAYDNFA